MESVEMIITTDNQSGSQHIILRQRESIEETAEAASRLALGVMASATVIGLGKVVTIHQGKAQEVKDWS